MSNQIDRKLTDDQKAQIIAKLQQEAEEVYKLSLPARAGERRKDDRRKGQDTRLADRRVSEV